MHLHVKSRSARVPRYTVFTIDATPALVVLSRSFAELKPSGNTYSIPRPMVKIKESLTERFMLRFHITTAGNIASAKSVAVSTAAKGSA